MPSAVGHAERALAQQGLLLPLRLELIDVHQFGQVLELQLLHHLMQVGSCCHLCGVLPRCILRKPRRRSSLLRVLVGPRLSEISDGIKHLLVVKFLVLCIFL